jgi:hypothetical protein
VTRLAALKIQQALLQRALQGEEARGANLVRAYHVWFFLLNGDGAE